MLLRNHWKVNFTPDSDQDPAEAFSFWPDLALPEMLGRLVFVSVEPVLVGALVGVVVGVLVGVVDGVVVGVDVGVPVSGVLSDAGDQCGSEPPGRINVDGTEQSRAPDRVQIPSGSCHANESLSGPQLGLVIPVNGPIWHSGVGSAGGAPEIALPFTEYQNTVAVSL